MKMLIHLSHEIVNDSFTLHMFFLTFLEYVCITFVVKNKLFWKVTWGLVSNYLSLFYQDIT